MFLSIISGCTFFENKDQIKKLSNNDFREIINNFSMAIKRNSQNFSFFLERGRARHDYGDFKRAIVDFNYSLRLNPNPKIIFYRANSKYAYGDYKGAIKDFEQLISKKFFQNQVFYKIGSSHLILLNYLDAIKNYTEYIKYDKDEANAYLNRGDAKFKLGDHVGAINDYKKSIQFRVFHTSHSVCPQLVQNSFRGFRKVSRDFEGTSRGFSRRTSSSEKSI